VVDEPDNLTHRLLRDIRAKQDEHSDRLGRVEAELHSMNRRFDDLEREMAYALGLGTRSIVKHKEQDARLNELFDKVEALLSSRDSST
jgi:predicted nuclease with TOPRIM domain